ncbi:MAG: GAF domain-containing protein [Halapricum sp.]
MSRRVRVLHVDDDPDFVDMAATFLERADDRIDVSTAENAERGWDRLTGGTFDCIVSDYEMPGQNGIEFLQRVREDHPELPFILYTGKGSEEVASDAISAGATDYLQKKGGTDQYELLANRILNAVEQYRSARRAAELDRIRTLASDVNQALVRAESREEAERRVCEIISDSEPYLFAWVGEIDDGMDEIAVRASAGLEAGYLDETTVTADETGTGHGPAGTAVRERRVAVSQSVADDPAFEPWREAALEREYRAVAAVPLEHGGELYGVLVVYADHSGAFDRDERDLLSELGDDISHALHSFDVRDRLRQERDRRRALFENAPGPVIAGEIHDGGAEHRIVDVNEAFEDVFEYEAAAVVGRDIADVIVPEDGMAQHEEFRKLAAAGEPTTAEIERVTADGPHRFVLHLIPYGAGQGHADGWYAWYTDITGHREGAIEELHRTADALMEATTTEAVANITADAVHDILDMSANGVHLYHEDDGGLVPVAWTDETEAIVGKPPTFAPGEGIAGVAFETGESQIYDDISTVTDRFNPDTAVRSQIALPLDGHGVLLIGALEPDAFDDVDVWLAETLQAHAASALNRIEHERELREERTFVEQALDTLDDIFYVIAPGGELRRWNQRLPEITGYSDEEISELPATEFFPEDERQRVDDAISRAVETGWTIVETELRTADDDHIPYEFTGNRLNDSEGDLIGIVGIGRDITERRERERKLIALHDVADALTACDSVEQICKRTIEASQTILEYDLCAIDIEDDGVLRPIAQSKSIPTSDPTEMSVEEGLAGKTYRTGESLLIDDLETVDAADSQGPYEAVISVPIGDHGVFQAVARSTGTFDQSDLELAELLLSHTKSALDRLDHDRQLQRQNERLDEFASVVSHDLRNPLNVAQGRLELANEECDSPHLENAANAIERSLSLIEDLLTLAREGERVSGVESVDLAATMEACWQTVETDDATLATETIAAIQADASRLKQLLENLIRNAVEHGNGAVTITIGDLDDGFYVADDGPGIPETEREQVFEPGYSTTETGTGFGLNIVREIVDAHGWDIRITTSESGGARFEIIGVDVDD